MTERLERNRMKTDWEKEMYEDIAHNYTILPKAQANTIILIIQQEIKEAVNEVILSYGEVKWCEDYAYKEIIDNKKEVLSKRGIK